MPNISVDSRIKFQKTITLPGPTASISLQIFGGPLARFQVAVFDANDKVLQAIGFGPHGFPLTTENGGQTSWLFEPVLNAAYMKWGVQAVRSAANLGMYSVTVKVRDPDGNPIVTSQFSAAIPDGEFADDIIYDGVNLQQVAPAMPIGAQV